MGDANSIAKRSEAELVASIVSGEPGADDELVRRYSRGVSLVLRHAAGDRSVAEDLFQETFRICLDKLRRGDLRQAERLSGFICSVARNLVISHFRQSARAAKSAAIELPESLADARPDQLSVILENEKAKIARQVLEELNSPRDRELLRRFYVDEEDKEQICADLGLSNLHFNRVLYRARERYKQLYEKVVGWGGIKGRRGSP